MTATQVNRLATGGRIDRAAPLSFRFNGRELQGFRGDSIASALLANGIQIVNRSFKYRRPRGVLSAGVEEPNALLRVGGRHGELPVVRSTVRALREGHDIRSPQGFPSVDFDLGRILDFTHRLWPAGFYNKTFKWPDWHWYEDSVRRMAGLGELPAGDDHRRYFNHNLHCDLLIVGAGPAGLAAALSAAGSGARVLLVEQDMLLGGSLLGDPARIGGVDSDQWVRDSGAQLQSAPNVTVMTSATVSGCYDHNVLTVTDRSTPGVVRFWVVRAGEVLLATGAIEQPLVFENNDRPGIMLAGAAMTYVHRYAVRPAADMVVATNNDAAWRVAFALQDHGVQVPAIVDARPQPPGRLVAEAEQRGIPVRPGSFVLGTVGSKTLSGIRVGRLSGDGRTVSRPVEAIACRGLAMSGGLNPVVHLYSQARGELRYDEELACFLPTSCRQRVTAAGAANGRFALAAALTDGASAGAAAAARAGRACSPVAVETDAVDSYGLKALRIAPTGDASRQWVDFLHDVTVADIKLAVRENFVAVEHLKRYTTVGMAADQGKTSNLNALAVLAGLTGRSPGEVGTTTFRPHYTPVPLGAIAGLRKSGLYAPSRRLPAYDWHLARDAVFEHYGAWRRPEYYATGGRDRETVIREEVMAVRTSAGLFDGSTLGKFELKGPDAGAFLNRIFVNNALTLEPGHIRYGLMLTENGIVMDDGVFARLSGDHYLVTSTSANADHFLEWMEQWHQCEWPELELIISPVTSQWAVATVAGPEARSILQSLDSDIDFSPQAMPHMSLATGSIGGLPARVQRVSFTGEMSFEINVPAMHGADLMEAIMHAGGAAVAPFGIEALIVLRTEKGYLEVGADTDGMTNALDVGFGGIVDRKPGDFVGRRSLLRAEDQRGDRRQFVGVEPLDPNEELRPGGHFIAAGTERRSQGVVTSACFSPTLGRAIGLGLLERGFERKGETVTVFDDGRAFEVRITSPTHYDPAGERLHA